MVWAQNLYEKKLKIKNLKKHKKNKKFDLMHTHLL